MLSAEPERSATGVGRSEDFRSRSATVYVQLRGEKTYLRGVTVRKVGRLLCNVSLEKSNALERRTTPTSGNRQPFHRSPGEGSGEDLALRGCVWLLTADNRSPRRAGRSPFLRGVFTYRTVAAVPDPAVQCGRFPDERGDVARRGHLEVRSTVERLQREVLVHPVVGGAPRQSLHFRTDTTERGRSRGRSADHAREGGSREESDKSNPSRNSSEDERVGRGGIKETDTPTQPRARVSLLRVLRFPSWHFFRQIFRPRGRPRPFQSPDCGRGLFFDPRSYFPWRLVASGAPRRAAYGTGREMLATLNRSLSEFR